MSDILLRYLLTARRRERSLFRRLFLRDGQWLEAGVEQLVETAAVSVGVRSQHEAVSYERVERFASGEGDVRFYDVAEPRRPTPGRFEEGIEEFPLGSTRKVFNSCTKCSGTGGHRCDPCGGRGTMKCERCSGTGGVSQGSRVDRRPFPLTGYRCSRCEGFGNRRCSHCWGSGQQTCRSCNGDGYQVRWKVEVYRWLIENRYAEEYPHDDQHLAEAVDRWLEVDAEQVENLEPATAVEHLGFESPEALEVVARADATGRRLEDEARRSKDTYLFHQTAFSLVPAVYTVVRHRGTAHYYWLVGRGDKALEVAPKDRPDTGKLAGWLGFGPAAACSWEAVIRWIELASGLILDPWQMLAPMPDAWLAGGLGTSTLLLAAGAYRVLRRKTVSTIGLLPSSGEPTSWLPCLAYLGSYTRRLTVLSRAYDTQLARLLGKPRPKRQSENLTLEIPGGRRIRLIEITRPERPSDDQLRLILQAFDCVMILEEKNAPGAELESRLRRLTTRESETAGIDRITIDRAVADRAAGLPASGAVPIEAIRRAFVEEMAADIDWSRQFERLWSPLERLLGDGPSRAGGTSRGPGT